MLHNLLQIALKTTMTTGIKVLKYSDAQRQLLGSLSLNFKEDNFESFEKTFEGLVSYDTENKKLVLDQVLLNRHEHVYGRRS